MPLFGIGTQQRRLARPRPFHRERHGIVKGQHIAEHHVFDRLRRGRSVPFFLQRKIPTRPAHPAGGTVVPPVADDADFILRGQCLHRRQRALFTPVIALRHFTRVHDEHERAFGNLPLGRNFHVDGQHVFELAADPSAGAEGVRPADHHQPTAHVVNVTGEVLILLFIQPAETAPFGDVGQNHRVIILQLDKIIRKLLDPLRDQVDSLGGQRLRQHLARAKLACGIAGIVDVQNLPLPAHEGECLAAVVAEQRIHLAVSIALPFKRGFETMRAGLFQPGNLHPERRDAGLENDGLGS